MTKSSTPKKIRKRPTSKPQTSCLHPKTDEYANREYCLVCKASWKV